ncbi:hypothetical protein PSHT_00388 [Puccinia striiformis]|uniref:Uncharacterized protein n=4 Tax=Puccinia striiformis TaxID=27350 RepID=A0A0L0VVV1_9BASI|nr:hypothetical protein PSTG_03705 [Puccinia striiformis f. sp. tritici PST-78]POW23242.1 hypothetical protein PSHT_00388 [Puccinia striiformis]
MSGIVDYEVLSRLLQQDTEGRLMNAYIRLSTICLRDIRDFLECDEFFRLGQEAQFLQDSASLLGLFDVARLCGHISNWCGVALSGGYPGGLEPKIRSLETANSSAQVWILSFLCDQGLLRLAKK